MSEEAFDDVLDDLFNEDVSGTAWTGFLTLAGYKQARLGDLASGDLVRRDTFRGSAASEMAARAELRGRSLLLRCLPAIQSSLTGGAGAGLQSVLAASDASAWNRETFTALWSLVREAATAATHSVSAGVMICAALIRRGLSSVAPFEGGCSPIEAEIGFAELDLKVFSDSVLALSPDGESVDQASLGEAALDRALAEVASSESDPARWMQAGDILWSVLFPRRIEGHLERCLASARAEGFNGVRIRLSIEAPKLLSAPWELARYPVTGEFLGTSRSILLSRYLHRGVRGALSPTFGVKKLAVVASDSLTRPTLNAQEEIAHLRRIAASSSLTLIPVSPATPRAIRAALQGSDAEAFHYIGHGSFESERGTIFLCGESGELERYDSAQLAPLLLDLPALRTVFLNSCEGANSSDYRAFSGMAAGLVQQGVPVVVAMQRKIRDKAAIAFSDVFYRYLANGFPETYATQRGRQRLLTETGHLKHDFMTPVVFTGY